VFRDGATVLGTRPLVDGTAVLVTSFGEGAHPITAEYLGDGTCPPAVSDPVNLVVNRITSTTTASALPQLTLRFVPAVLSARVTCPGETPTGTVTFLDGATPLGTVPLISGSALLITSFTTSGQHSITAAYSGDDHCAPSVSPPVIVTVL
jgi:hypothetical protein